MHLVLIQANEMAKRIWWILLGNLNLAKKTDCFDSLSQSYYLAEQEAEEEYQTRELY